MFTINEEDFAEDDVYQSSGPLENNIREPLLSDLRMQERIVKQ
jgi:hypothetical protein